MFQDWPFDSSDETKATLNPYFEATRFQASRPPKPEAGKNSTDITVSIVVEEVDSFSDKKKG